MLTVINEKFIGPRFQRLLIMARELPGLFFNEEKGKYFPISLKAAYEIEKKAKDAVEKELNLQKALQNATEEDLYKYLGNQPRQFDNIKEKISRLQVVEFNNSNKFYFDLRNDRYYEALRRNKRWVVRTYSLPSPAKGVLDQVSFEPRSESVLLGFAVFKVSACTSMYFFLLDAMDTINYQVFERDCEDDSEFIDLIDEELGPHSSHIFHQRQGQFLIHRNSVNQLKVNEVIMLDRDNKRFTFSHTAHVYMHPDTGFIQIRDGTITIPDKNWSTKLDQSSVQWLTYYKGNLFIMTFHGQFICINLNDPTNHIFLFNASEMEIFTSNKEKLIIESVYRIVAFAYFKGKKILFFDLETCKFIDMITVDKKIQQFKLSDDVKNLYIRYNVTKS